MKDELEKLIISNRQAIQDEEPMEGHFERFEARLNKASKPAKTISLRPLMKVAAIVVFVLLAGNQLRMWFFPEKEEAITLGAISEEYREVEFYYTNAIQLGMNQWEKLSDEGLVTEAEQKMMQQEQHEFDQLYQQLQEELKSNPNDDRVINAMLEYYQARMNVITMIINKLEEVKQLKNKKSHEIEI